MKYAVFTVACPEYDIPDVPAKLKSLGYDGIEWRVADRPAEPKGTNFWTDNKATLAFDRLMEEGPRVRAMTEAAGLSCPALGFYVNCSQPEKVRQALSAAANMGVPAARISVPGYDGSVNYNELFKQAVAQYREVEKIAADTGVKALVELHMGNIVPSASAAYRFLSNFDPAHVGAMLDPGNMIYEGFENWQLGCEVLGPYLSHVHAKNAKHELRDVDADGRALWTPGMATLRGGEADWLKIMKALRKVGYNGWISLEDFSTARPIDERLRDDVEFLRQMERKA